MAGAAERRGLGHEARPRAGQSYRAKEGLSRSNGVIGSVSKGWLWLLLEDRL